MPRNCSNDDCHSRGFYNFLGITDEVYCGVHRKDGMINIKSKKCKSFGCIKLPSFNFEGLKPEYCYEHKEENMILVKNIKCVINDCIKRANYKNFGESKPTHCFQHKNENMVIHKKHKGCIINNCGKHTIYNFEGLPPRFCKIHKEEEMIDVLNNKCEAANCKIQKSYNYKGLPKKFCFTHKLPGMVDVKNSCCEFEDCDKQPSYNFENCNTLKFCHEHRLNGMVDIRNRKNKCFTELCDIIVRSKDKYKGYCVRCFIHLFPDEPVTRNYKTKESAVVQYIFSEFPIEKYSWVSDKKILDGCSKKRPDLLLDLGYQVIIIEVDENQHTNYDCSCENKRLMELSQDVGHRPIIFIRFNPDDYNDINGKTVISCWGLNKNGISSVKKSKAKEWQERLLNLKSQIEYWINGENKSSKTIEIIQLYFDNYTNINKESKLNY